MGFGNVFAGIHTNTTAIGGNFAPKIPEGNSLAVLKRFEPKDSSTNMGTILEADFVIGKSEVARVGGTYGWPWFIGQTGWAGKYEGARAKQFIQAVMESLKPHIETEMPYGQLQDGRIVPLNPYDGKVFIGALDGQVKLAHDDETIGELMALGYFKGVQLAVEVRKNYKKDGSLRVDNNGKQTFNSFWTAIPQTYEQVKAMAASLDAQTAAPATTPVAASAPAAAQTVAPAPAQTIAATPVAAQVQTTPVAAQPIATQPVGAVSVQPIGGAVLAGLRKS